MTDYGSLVIQEAKEMAMVLEGEHCTRLGRILRSLAQELELRMQQLQEMIDKEAKECGQTDQPKMSSKT